MGRGGSRRKASPLGRTALTGTYINLMVEKS
jgi:hypothetical protein